MAGTREKRNTAAGFAAGASASGGTLTAALSGGSSGDAWDRLIYPGDIGSTNTLDVQTTPTPPSLPTGTKWYHLAQAPSAQAIKIYWTKPTARTVWAANFYLRVVTPPASGSVNLLQAFSDAVYGSGNLAASVNLNASRSMYLRNGKTGEAASGSNSSAVLALNTNYTCQVLLDYGSLTATLNVYPYGSTTLFLTATVPFTTSNTVQSMYWGLGTTATATSPAEIYVANIEEGYGDFLPRPDVVNSGPVISQSAAVRRTFQTGTTVTFPWSVTDDGTIASITGSWQTLPAGASAPTVTDSVALTGIGTGTASRTESAVLASPGTYVRLLTATDNLGTVTTATYTIEVYPAVGVDTIIRSVSKGAFTVVGGGADTAAGALAALTDSNAATGLDSVVTPTGMTGRLQLGPLGPTGIVIYVSANVVVGGTLTRVWRVYKEDGLTQIFTTTETGITGVTTDVPLVLDNAALTAVPLNSSSDVGRAALWVEWSDTIA